MPTPRIFEHRSVIPATVEDVTAFHDHPRAFQRLTPPPVFIQIRRHEVQSLTHGKVAFTMWFGPVPVRWVAQHEPGPIATSFIDRQINGPMAQWIHEHVFQPVENGVELIDRVTYAHKPGWRGWLTRLFFDGLPLRFLFTYRHWRTRKALKAI